MIAQAQGKPSDARQFVVPLIRPPASAVGNRATIRRSRATCAAVVAAAALAAAGTLAARPAAAAARARDGRLAGRTEISLGCPAVRPGSTCRSTRPYPGARFSVSRMAPDGAPRPGGRIVASNPQAVFSTALPAGAYVIAPLASKGTAGARIDVRVRAGLTTRVVVRFRSLHPIV